MRSKTYQEKLTNAMLELQAAGISKLNARPLLFRILVSAGVQMRPPLYFSTRVTFFGYSAFFSVMWMAFLGFVKMSGEGGGGFQLILIKSVLAGLCFGAAMMAVQIFYQRRYKLSLWENL